MSDALEQIAAFDGRGDIRAASRLLISADGDDVEPTLLRIMAEAQSVYVRSFGVASRILAERDPDRDPEYLLRYIPSPQQPPATSSLGRFARYADMYPPPGAHRYGLSRLRRADPVRVYSDLLTAPS